MIDSINSIFSTLFSSVDTSLYSLLDEITFIDSDILNKFVLEPLMMRNKNNLFDGPQSKVVSEAIANYLILLLHKK